MARKSKGFNELLETQKRTQQQQKFLESFKSKLEREPIGGKSSEDIFCRHAKVENLAVKELQQ